MSEENTELEQGPSKSQLKREAEAMTKLGEQLAALDRSQLGRLNLADNILTAIHDYRKIRQHGARKRQLHYLGKLLRKIDVSDIVSQLDSLNKQSQEQNRAFHELEQWRDKLLKDDQALTELLNTHPDIDRQHIRQLIRTARNEQTANKPPAAARSLFKYLRSMLLSD
jgi:ribosome-associated protein